MGEGRCRALLIGNWKYASPDGPSLLPLRGPEHDLTRMRAALTHADFGLATQDLVKVRENLGTDELRDELMEHIEDCPPDELLLIYYSGHGERLGGTQTLGLVGVDVPYEKRRSRALNTTQLSEWLGDARAQSKILILDCCYSGQFRSGGLVDDDALGAFGKGTVVLASGGNQVVPDVGVPDGPSPFTDALTAAMVDDALAGRDGWLSADDVYRALLSRTPRLVPEPKIHLSTRGLVRLARRPRPERLAEVPSWPARLKIVRVSVTFAKDRIKVAWDRNGDGVLVDGERDSAAIEAHRLAAVRRLCELADGVMSARHKDKDSREPASTHWQHRARYALDTAGVNLFEAALPGSLQQFLREAPTRPDEVVRVDLGFEAPWTALAELPWEYLGAPSAGGPGAAPGATGGMGGSILVTRSSTATEHGARKPGVTDQDQLTVAVVNSLHAPQDRLAVRVEAELQELAGISVVTSPSKLPAEWHQFIEAVEQKPRYLVLCAPVRRDRDQSGRPGAKVGFGARDFRDVGSLVVQLGRGDHLDAVVLVTVASEQGGDSFRAAPMVARELSEGLNVPVVFVCHSPALQRHFSDELATGTRTFVGLLMTCLSCGKPLDESVWFARERAQVYMSNDMLPTFGIPGLVEARTGPSRPRASGRVEAAGGRRADSRTGPRP